MAVETCSVMRWDTSRGVLALMGDLLVDSEFVVETGGEDHFYVRCENVYSCGL